MAKGRHLTKRQLAVLDDLFNSELDEQGVLDRHRVRLSTYNRWLADEVFAERFRQHINRLKRRYELLIAKYGCFAAAKLVELTECKKEETARKACLDVMVVLNRLSESVVERSKAGEGVENKEATRISAEAAGRLLAALAEKG